MGAIRANLIVISGSGGNGEREAHRDTESAVYVTWAEGRELPREIRGGHDKTGEDGIGIAFRREEIDFTRNEKGERVNERSVNSPLSCYRLLYFRI